jgi:hypothetical protein
MPDPGWAARTPEDNDLVLKAGTGVGAHVANQAAWTVVGASHHACGIASAINTVATEAGWAGAGSAASAANATMLNASLHGLAGWVCVKPAVVAAAITAYQTANAGMRPAPECVANRVETATDNAINPSVLWTLTPRIAALELEYYGTMWPNNAAVGAAYGAVLAGLAASLAIAPPVAGLGASPEAPAQAASAVGEAAAQAAAGDGMRAAYQGVQTGTTATGPAASSVPDVGGQLGSFMAPVQALTGAAPQALQAPAEMLQLPMSAMQPLPSLQSLTGLFTGTGVPDVVDGAETGVPIGGGGAPAGEAAPSPGGMPATTFTRPVSAFEPGTGGRPVGLRPSGALGTETLRPPTTTVAGTSVGGMPVGRPSGGQRRSDDKSTQPATVRVVEDPVP